jgi:4-hydroxybenzoate polyprenyltransferase/phosphoserine phosphatase
MQSIGNQSFAQSLFVVDLDETLLKTDLLYEKLAALVAQAPLSCLEIPWRLLQGKLKFKKWLYQKVRLDYRYLPYRQEILQRVNQARMRGQRTLLLSASLQEEVAEVAKVLQIFDEAIGSQDQNLKGEKKLEILNQQYPGAKFTYVGDSGSDFDVWSHCSQIIAVNPTKALTQKIKKLDCPVEILSDSQGVWVVLAKQMRVYQWVKNILVFIPVFAAHRFHELTPWLSSARAFLAFSFLASSVYLLNDLTDLATDRRQDSKKSRPLAAGHISLKLTLGMIPLCWAIVVWLSWGLPVGLSLVLGGYLAMNFIYSLWVKEWLALDVLFLAGFYTLRIFAGGAVSHTVVSEWLLSFSIFFFSGLAMVKRYSELITHKPGSALLAAGRRAYQVRDSMSVLVIGVANSILSVLVLALYLSTGEVKRLYSKPEIMWLTTPFLLFWINRLWILGARGLVTEDPIVFAIKDKLTWGVLAVMVILVFIAK